MDTSDDSSKTSSTASGLTDASKSKKTEDSSPTTRKGPNDPVDSMGRASEGSRSDSKGFEDREEEMLTMAYARFLIHFPILLFLILLAWIGFVIDLTIGYPARKLEDFCKSRREFVSEDKKEQLDAITMFFQKVHQVASIFGTGGKNSALLTLSFWQEIWKIRDKTGWPIASIAKAVEPLHGNPRNMRSSLSRGQSRESLGGNGPERLGGGFPGPKVKTD